MQSEGGEGPPDNKHTDESVDAQNAIVCISFICRPIGLEEDPAGFANEAGQPWMCSAELRALAEVNALGISGTESEKERVTSR